MPSPRSRASRKVPVLISIPIGLAVFLIVATQVHASDFGAQLDSSYSITPANLGYAPEFTSSSSGTVGGISFYAGSGSLYGVYATTLFASIINQTVEDTYPYTSDNCSNIVPGVGDGTHGFPASPPTDGSQSLFQLTGDSELGAWTGVSGSGCNGFPMIAGDQYTVSPEQGGDTMYGWYSWYGHDSTKGSSPSDYTTLYYEVSSGLPPPATPFYAQIQNLTTSSTTMYASVGLSTPLKTFPQGWIIEVASTTDASGNPTIADGKQWYQVIDPTDGSNGWMEGANASGTTQYLPYDPLNQSTFIASSTEGVLTSKSDWANKIIEAVTNYYSNTSTSSSLYSSDDGDNDLSVLFNNSGSPATFPQEIVYAIAGWESGHSLDNSIVTPDYGHGIMQITASPAEYDIYYLEKFLNNDPDTVVSTTTGAPGSPGYETHTFDNLVENAVERFQTKYGITVSGIVDSATRTELNLLHSSTSVAGIPNSFEWERTLSTESDGDVYEDYTGYYDNRGIASNVTVPACGEQLNNDSANYEKNCYTNSSPNAYATSTSYDQLFESYDNTGQSVYANIKDGLGVLQQKYNYCLNGGELCDVSDATTTIDGETYSYDDALIVLATWGYNGFDYSPSDHYLEDIGDELENINSDFSSISNPPTGTGTWVNKLLVADNNQIDFMVESPVDISIIDSQGRSTGVINGKTASQIPDSAYNPNTKSGIILFPKGTYSFKIQGTDSGTYGFHVHAKGDSSIGDFGAQNIPIAKGETELYTINPDLLNKGEKGGITVTIESADGLSNRIINTDSSLSDLFSESSIVTSSSTPSFLQDTSTSSPQISTSTPNIVVITSDSQASSTGTDITNTNESTTTPTVIISS